jgi:hypothetical protein
VLSSEPPKRNEKCSVFSAEHHEGS